MFGSRKCFTVIPYSQGSGAWWQWKSVSLSSRAAGHHVDVRRDHASASVRWIWSGTRRAHGEAGDETIEGSRGSLKRRKCQPVSSAAFVTQEPFLVRTCMVMFPVRKRFWFCFVQVSTTQFCSFPAISWPVRATANVPISSAPASSDFGSNSFVSDFIGTGHPLLYHNGWEAGRFSKFSKFKEQIEQIPTLANEMSRMDSHSTKTLEDFTTRLAEMEQNFSTHTARMCKVETCSFSIKCIRFGLILAIRWTGWRLHSHRVPWPRIIWFLILLQAPKMNNHEVTSYYSSLVKMTTLGLRNWINKHLGRSNILAYKSIRIQCKTCSKSASLAFETRAQCQGLDGPMQGLYPYEVYGLLCQRRTVVTVRQSNITWRPRNRKSICVFVGNTNSKAQRTFQEEMNTGTIIVFALDVRSQVSHY